LVAPVLSRRLAETVLGGPGVLQGGRKLAFCELCSTSRGERIQVLAP
jgi:hypothetical protein